jgi:hypothetical protein
MTNSLPKKCDVLYVWKVQFILFLLWHIPEWGHDDIAFWDSLWAEIYAFGM